MEGKNRIVMNSQATTMTVISFQFEYWIHCSCLQKQKFVNALLRATIQTLMRDPNQNGQGEFDTLHLTSHRKNLTESISQLSSNMLPTKPKENWNSQGCNLPVMLSTIYAGDRQGFPRLTARVRFCSTSTTVGR
jgi:hypothetical protein